MLICVSLTGLLLRFYPAKTDLAYCLTNESAPLEPIFSLLVDLVLPRGRFPPLDDDLN
jgi:hypothetical protein